MPYMCKIKNFNKGLKISTFPQDLYEVSRKLILTVRNITTYKIVNACINLCKTNFYHALYSSDGYTGCLHPLEILASATHALLK